MDYAIEVMKAIKESGYEIDYPLEQYINVSTRIGADLSRTEFAGGQDEFVEAYKEASMNAFRSIYRADILSELEDYSRIPFAALREKCQNLQAHIDSSIKVLGTLTGRRMF